jgi:sugar phosphate isomerase/epimerase
MINIGGTSQPLILANNCLGDCPFVDRVEAAASAGFDAIGLSLPAYRAIVAGQAAPNEILAVLRANGLRLLELEAIIGFSARGTNERGMLAEGLSYTSPDDLREFWEIASIFEPRHLQVAGSFHTTVLEKGAAERFAELCDAAAEVGLILSIEFVPPSNVPNANVALDIVEDADRPNGVITIDSWSHTRAGGDLETVRSIPAARIGLLQINDGALEPEVDDFIEETVHLRRAPGEGEFDLRGLVDAIVATGARPPVSVEVMSDELNRLSPLSAAQRLADGAKALFAD